jgi:hypothetical protein
VLLFNGLAALPTPGEASIERLQRPFERAELQRWAQMLSSLGIDTEPDRLAQGYLSFSRGVERVREIALTPIAGWMALTQTHQGWRLFGTPDREVSALRVTAHTARGDEVSYESGHPTRRWHAAFLEYRRIRAEYTPSRRGPPATYQAFARRLSDEVFATRPDVERVSIALPIRRVRLPREAEHVAPERLDHVLEFARPGS